MTLFEQAAPVTGEELRRFDQLYREARTNGSLPDVPDGRYVASIDGVSLTRANTGNPVIIWKLRIAGPRHAGRILWKRRAITGKTIPYVKEDLEICGLALNQFSDLVRELNSMVGVEVEVNKRSKGGRQEVYLVRPKAIAAAAGARGGEDGIAF